MQQENNKQIVYILTNEAMPNLVKVGKTDVSIEQRMKDLYKTGVPVPFECFHASVVENAQDVEKRIHRAFDKFRVNKNREFFEIQPENILEILGMVEIEDVTPQEDFIETVEDKKAIEKLEKKAERVNFKMVGIEIGSELLFSKDENIKCKVIDNHRVLYNDEKMSLSASALDALKSLGHNWKSAQGAAYWKYGNETLKERRERMENE